MIIDAGEVPGRVPVASTWVAQHAVANPPGCVGLGDFPQKELCKKRSGFARRRGEEAALPGRGQRRRRAGRNPQVCGPEPLDRVTMEIVLGRTRAEQEPGTSSSATERARDRARRLFPRPGSLFLRSRPGRASPPRAAAAAATEQPAGRAELSPRAASSRSASSQQPAWAASGAVSQPRSWDLKRQTRRRALGGPGQEGSPASSPKVHPNRAQYPQSTLWVSKVSCGEHLSCDLPRPPLLTAEQAARRVRIFFSSFGD